MNSLSYALRKHPIIVSLTDPNDLQLALESDSSIIILIQADICTLNRVVKQIKKTDKLIFVHIDLMKGLKRDASGIKFLADDIGIDGIVTTQTSLIALARKFQLLTIQRVFILDSASIKQGIKSIQESRPDAVEILPGIVVPHIKDYIQKSIHQTVIAGGLINTEEEILTILQSGAKGISSSSIDLWKSSSHIKDALQSKS